MLKKIILLSICLVLVSLSASCNISIEQTNTENVPGTSGDKPENVELPDNELSETEQTDLRTKITDIISIDEEESYAVNTGKTIVKELLGYKFYFTENVDIESYDAGKLISGSNYSMFLTREPEIVFTSWDDVLENIGPEVQKTVSTYIDSIPIWCRFNSTKTIENRYGYELVQTNGSFYTENDEIRNDFICVFYRTEDNTVRYIVSLVNENEDILSQEFSMIINNFRKIP